MSPSLPKSYKGFMEPPYTIVTPHSLYLVPLHIFVCSYISLSLNEVYHVCLSS